MKIQMNYSGVGPAAFMGRLKNYLQSHYDVKIVGTTSQASKKCSNKHGIPDLYLSSVWRGRPPKGCKTIHRADGVYFDKNLKSGPRMNRDIWVAIQKANAVIYQSKYSMKSCRKILKVSQRNDIIIHNGFDFSLCENVIPDMAGFERTFVAGAKWRALKRPLSIANGFLKASLPNTGLLMLGAISKSDMIKHPSIKYVGKVNHSRVFQYYKGCSGIIHISRLDACPNAVVEGLAFGKPILCNNTGGTPEIVKDSGILLDIDPPFTYKRFPLKNPDSVKPSIVAAGLHELLNREWNIDRQDLSMEVCAKKYYDFFQKVLEC